MTQPTYELLISFGHSDFNRRRGGNRSDRPANPRTLSRRKSRVPSSNAAKSKREAAEQAIARCNRPNAMTPNAS